MLTSRRDARVHDIREAAKSKGSLLVLEGPILLGEAVRRGLPLELVLWTEAAAAEETLAATVSLAAPSRGAHVASAAVLDYVCEARTPQGVVALARHSDHIPFSRISPHPLLLVLDGIADPGNAGSLLRSAEAFGVEEVFVLAGGAYPFAPKALRASAGAALSLPTHADVDGPWLARQLADRGIALVATDPHRGSPPESFDWRAGAALVVGAEAHGVSAVMRSGQPLRIPMQAGVESLNAGVAAAIALYAAFRARVQ